MKVQKTAQILFLVLEAIFFIVAVASLTYGCSERSTNAYFISSASFFLFCIVGYILHKTGNHSWIGDIKNIFWKKRREKMETIKGIEKGILGRFRLNLEEINNVLDVIDKEIGKSRAEDKLIIMKKDETLEKFLFLCALEQWGGIEKTKRNFSIEIITKDMEKRIETYFEPFKLENSIETKEEEKENQKKYTAHLEAVKRGIVSLIFENKL